MVIETHRSYTAFLPTLVWSLCPCRISPAQISSRAEHTPALQSPARHRPTPPPPDETCHECTARRWWNINVLILLVQIDYGFETGLPLTSNPRLKQACMAAWYVLSSPREVSSIPRFSAT